ncbi:glycoside hydrolase family 43 protein [Fulvivirga sediminis]|uniref:Family 43 glycosylhydrolase n=1 Tax=Fulvivirga sediminis TaxID=2803949 RepID=A0A937FAC2_9BACT|nr:glycoside hydrolase family 43 protein [Fulvivirga sediminis]MBL3657199.1 family 43 glycosylhydrolase [Fulvivirga sediminis]
MKSSRFFHFAFLILLSHYSFGQNPIIQTMYTADPAPMVYNDKLYLYTGHDEDESTWFVMNNWKLYTTEDMVNWTDHGAVASYKIFDWASGDAWAMQVTEKNGKFYLYAPVISRETNSPAIGVAISDSPYGPFIDPLGKPLVQTGKGDIDPAVFIDDDGQAYLYWGNPFCYFMKLNEDMISYNGDINKVPMTVDAFGKREGQVKDRPTLYEEGPWLYKRKENYYLLWAGGPLPEHLGYSLSQSPEGPWTYGDVLMPAEGRSFTNHPGLIDFKGKTYLFYHNGALPGGSGFNRSVCVQEVQFQKNGEIQPLTMNGAAINKALQTLNPYQKNEAETIAWSEGVKADQNEAVGVFVKATQDNAYIQVKSVDFKEGANKFRARLGTTHYNDVNMEVRLDTKDGPLLTTFPVPMTKGSDRWALLEKSISKTSGIHDLYFVFRGKKPGILMYFDYWMFSR